MISISERYETLKNNLGDNEYIFIHKGVPNPAGGYFVDPRPDPDFGNLIPQLRVFYIARTKLGQQRAQELSDNGWQLYTGAPDLTDIKSSAQKEAELRDKIKAELIAEMEKGDKTPVVKKRGRRKIS